MHGPIVQDCEDEAVVSAVDELERREEAVQIVFERWEETGNVHGVRAIELERIKDWDRFRPTVRARGIRYRMVYGFMIDLAHIGIKIRRQTLRNEFVQVDEVEPDEKWSQGWGRDESAAHKARGRALTQTKIDDSFDVHRHERMREELARVDGIETKKRASGQAKICVIFEDHRARMNSAEPLEQSMADLFITA